MCKQGEEGEGTYIYVLHHYLKEPGMMFVCLLEYEEINHEEYSVTHEHYWDGVYHYYN